MRRSTTACQS